MSRSVIIVAGGTGTRMKSPRAKQMIRVGQKTILEMAIDQFLKFDPNIEVVLVLHDSLESEWKDILDQRSDYSEIKMAFGGPERFHSVQNGLSLLGECSEVGIHDAARPMVSLDTISRCYTAAMEKGAAVPVVNVNDSLRMLDSGGSKSVDRSLFKIVQTPQCFQKEILLKSYESEYLPEFTDDASVVEHSGHQISLVEGNRENIKITNPEDLTYLKGLLSSETR